jgi:tellurite resistance protein
MESPPIGPEVSLTTTVEQLVSFADRRARPDAHPLTRITPNLFGVALGLAGLGDAWWAAEFALGAPSAVSNAAYALAAVVWVGLVLAYVRQGPRQIIRDLRDPVLAPFVTAVPITGMVLSLALSQFSFDLGRSLVGVFLAATLALGAWLMGNWIITDLDPESAHPGYFLPTVAGGLIGAFTTAGVQLQTLAQLSFGIGMVSWFLLGSIVLNRLFFRRLLPAALLPTLAIESAPPAMAGVAYWAVTGGMADPFAYGLAGYAALMAVIQLRFLRVYRRLQFGPGMWAFTFAYSAIATDALLWIAQSHAPGATAYAVVVLGFITILILAIAVRTVVALTQHKFLPAAHVSTEQTAAQSG